jgi:hypothetical protein
MRNDEIVGRIRPLVDHQYVARFPSAPRHGQAKQYLDRAPLWILATEELICEHDHKTGVPKDATS